MRLPLERWLTAWRAARLRARGIELGPPLYILGATCIRHVFARGGRGRIAIGPRAMISHGVVVESWGGQVRLGHDVFLGPHTVIYGHGGVEIGDECLIAMHCAIVSSNHAVPAVNRTIQYEPDILLPTRLGRDVWLGAGVKVLGGVTIGDGCVVGAGAVVTRDLPAGAIARGTPAEITGWRDGAVKRTPA